MFVGWPVSPLSGLIVVVVVIETSEISQAPIPLCKKTWSEQTRLSWLKLSFRMSPPKSISVYIQEGVRKCLDARRKKFTVARRTNCTSKH